MNSLRRALAVLLVLGLFALTAPPTLAAPTDSGLGEESSGVQCMGTPCDEVNWVCKRIIKYYCLG